MGTDIHAAIEYNDGDGWRAVMHPNPYHGRWDGEAAETARLDFGRNYDAFAILANVRNGRGFAGIDTGDGFVPMTDNRGVPDDISKEARDVLSDEHSPTWVTLDEILAYDWTRESVHRGWVDGVTFEKWDRMKEWEPRPAQYCGDVSGGSIEKVSIDEMRRRLPMAPDKSRLYCQVSWTERYTMAAGWLWTVVVPMMLKLAQSHKQVRLVMDFDS